MLGHEEQDIRQLAEWGVDHIAVDNCYNANTTSQSVFEYQARPSPFSACGIFSPLSDILALWSPHCHEFRSVNFTDLIPEFPTS